MKRSVLLHDKARTRVVFQNIIYSKIYSVVFKMTEFETILTVY